MQQATWGRNKDVLDAMRLATLAVLVAALMALFASGCCCCCGNDYGSAKWSPYRYWCTPDPTVDP